MGMMLFKRTVEKILVDTPVTGERWTLTGQLYKHLRFTENSNKISTLGLGDRFSRNTLLGLTVLVSQSS